MNIEMIAVSSSNVDSIGYDESNEIVYVRFLNNSEYTYSGVPQHEFDGLLNAASVGSYLHRNYKNIYPYQKVA
ncbi:MAG: hypothetical protein ACI8WB_001948 [Phenylobacterium sp.]|jgi:hypothetical protein